MPKQQSKDNKPDIVAVAKKKRHIYLLEKLQSKKPPTRAEIKELAEYERGVKNPAVVDSQDKVALVFDVTARTIRDWVRNGMPVRKDGYYNILEIKDWRSARAARTRHKRTRKGRQEQRSQTAAQPDPANTSYPAPPDSSDSELSVLASQYNENTDWLTEKDKWDAISKRLKAEKESGKLIDKKDAVAALKMAVENVKTQFLALPRQLASQIAAMSDPVQIADLLDIRIREAINDFAKGKF